MYATDIHVNNHATIEAAKIMMFAHENIEIMEGAKIESLMDYECTST